MELLCIWIKDYKNIKDCGFNFGGEYLFDFDGEKLTPQKNPDYIKGFFKLSDDQANVLNVTGIVGKNGAGKSSLISFILPPIEEQNFANNYCQSIEDNIDQIKKKLRLPKPY